MENFIEEFKNKKILVIGDVMLDEYIFGKVNRISPEAPVPVVEATKTAVRAGGAANVALNLKTLGAKPSILGVIGKDLKGKILKEIFENKKINTKLLIEDESRPTTVKTRIMASSQQLLRVDWESKNYLNRKTLLSIARKLKEDYKNFDAILISDYGKGVITKELFKITGLLKQNGMIVTVDPKERNFGFYKDITSMTPNIKETYQATGVFPETDELTEKAGKTLIDKFNLDFALITRSEKGMSLITEKESFHIRSKTRQVYDVTGAGDTVISVFTLALSCGASPVEAAKLANISGSIVVGKLGTATVEIDEIKTALKNY